MAKDVHSIYEKLCSVVVRIAESSFLLLLFT